MARKMNMSQAPDIFYDILRDKAQAMGHAAAKLPDDVWDKYARTQYRRDTLKESKIYIEKYMMGELDPADLASIMANNDPLRYTISDICRVKLEPTDLNIERNGKYIDVGAGIKTFWTEIRVPLPSEIEAAKDLRNIYFGIEAGRAASGVEQKVQDVEVSEEEPKAKKSLRDRINDSRKVLAQKAIDKLTPLTEDKKTDSNKSFFDTFQEVKNKNDLFMDIDSDVAITAYNSSMQRQAAQNLENLIMAVEASKDQDLQPNQRVNALISTGISKEDAIKLVTEGKSNDLSNQGETKARSNQADNSLFSEADAAAAGIHEKQSRINQESLRSGYSTEDLNRPVNDEICELLDQISAHVNHDKAAQRKNYEQNAGQEVKNEPAQKNTNERVRKGYVSGEFEGQQVQFKGSWSKHMFSDEEVGKLLSGETISFTYLDAKNQEKQVHGKLEWQNYGGHEYLGFKANFEKKADVETKNDKSLFTAQDEMPAVENENAYELSADDVAKLFGDTSEVISEVKHEEEIELTDADLPALTTEMPFAK